jgi:16S rRNA (guanine527-N7)-methyltransferase
MMVSCHFMKLRIGQNVGQSPDFREGFDVAVARAVAELRILGLHSAFPQFISIDSSKHEVASQWCDLFCPFLFLAEYCLPLVRVGGLFVAAKGSDPQVKFLKISLFV